jgi:hypothetical protein
MATATMPAMLVVGSAVRERGVVDLDDATTDDAVDGFAVVSVAVGLEELAGMVS